MTARDFHCPICSADPDEECADRVGKSPTYRTLSYYHARRVDLVTARLAVLIRRVRA